MQWASSVIELGASLFAQRGTAAAPTSDLDMEFAPRADPASTADAAAQCVSDEERDAQRPACAVSTDQHAQQDSVTAAVQQQVVKAEPLENMRPDPQEQHAASTQPTPAPAPLPPATPQGTTSGAAAATAGTQPPAQRPVSKRKGSTPVRALVAQPSEEEVEEVEEVEALELAALEYAADADPDDDAADDPAGMTSLGVTRADLLPAFGSVLKLPKHVLLSFKLNGSADTEAATYEATITSYQGEQLKLRMPMAARARISSLVYPKRPADKKPARLLRKMLAINYSVQGSADAERPLLVMDLCPRKPGSLKAKQAPQPANKRLKSDDGPVTSPAKVVYYTYEEEEKEEEEEEEEQECSSDQEDCSGSENEEFIPGSFPKAPKAPKAPKTQRETAERVLSGPYANAKVATITMSDDVIVRLFGTKLDKQKSVRFHVTVNGKLHVQQAKASIRAHAGRYLLSVKPSIRTAVNKYFTPGPGGYVKMLAGRGANFSWSIEDAAVAAADLPVLVLDLQPCPNQDAGAVGSSKKRSREPEKDDLSDSDEKAQHRMTGSANAATSGDTAGRSRCSFTILEADWLGMFGKTPKLPMRVHFEITVRGELHTSFTQGNCKLIFNNGRYSLECAPEARLVVNTLLPVGPKGEGQLRRSKHIDYTWSLRAAEASWPVVVLDFKSVVGDGACSTKLGSTAAATTATAKAGNGGGIVEVVAAAASTRPTGDDGMAGNTATASATPGSAASGETGVAGGAAVAGGSGSATGGASAADTAKPGSGEGGVAAKPGSGEGGVAAKPGGGASALAAKPSGGASALAARPGSVERGVAAKPGNGSGASAAKPHSREGGLASKQGHGSDGARGTATAARPSGAGDAAGRSTSEMAGAGSSNKRQKQDVPQEGKVKMGPPTRLNPEFAASQVPIPPPVPHSMFGFPLLCEPPTEQEEEGFRACILVELWKLCPNATIDDVRRFYQRCIIRQRSTGTRDKYYDIGEAGCEVSRLRSYKEVADYIAERLRAPGDPLPTTPVPRSRSRTPKARTPPVASAAGGPSAEDEAQGDDEQQQQEQEQEQEQEQHEGSPEPRLAVLHHIHDTAAYVASLDVPELASETQKVVGTAIAVVFSVSTLDLPDVRKLLDKVPAPAAGSNSVAEMLPLLAGAVWSLPPQAVLDVMGDLLDAPSPGDNGREADKDALGKVQVELLVRAAEAAAQLKAGAGAGADGATEGSSSGTARKLQASEVRYLLQLQPELAVVPGEGQTKARWLLPAYKQVWKQSKAVVLLAACLAHAEQGRVGVERDYYPQMFGRVMRLLSQAVASGASAFTALKLALEVRLMGQEQQDAEGAGEAEGATDAEEGISDDVILALSEPEVEKVVDSIVEEQQGGEQLRSRLSDACMRAGMALHARGVADLKGSMVSVMRLAHSQQQGLPMSVETAVKVVASTEPEVFLHMFRAMDSLLEQV